MKKLLLVLTVMFVFFSTVACGKSSLVGAWENPDAGDELIFFEDGRGVVIYDDREYQISSWKDNNGTLTIDVDSSSIYFQPAKYKVSGNTLTVYKDDTEITYRKVNDSRYEF